MTVNITVLWDREIDFDGQDPLHEPDLSRTYEEFCRIADRKGGKMVISNFRYFEDGVLQKGVFHESGEWHRCSDFEVNVVYDKYKFDGKTRQLKKIITEKFHVINKFGLERICKDKLMTYKQFQGIVPETRVATKENVRRMLSESPKVVLKPRYDYGGEGVELIDSIEDFEPGENLLAQKFMDASKGYEELGVKGVHDLRVLVINGSPQAAYFRLADEGFISNVSMGGSIKFIDNEEIPEAALEKVREVSGVLEKWNPSFYSVDMVFDSEDEVHVLELNSKPGLNFYDDEEIRGRKKPVMENLIDQLVDN